MKYMEPVVIVLLAVFGVYSILHLVFCFLEKEKQRKITKPFCLLILGIAALVAAPAHPLIYVGAFLGAVGDFFLIKKNNIKWFLIGTAFFIAGHICYYTQINIYLHDMCGVDVPFWVYLLVGVVLIVCTFALYPATKSLAGPATLAGNFYMPLLLFILATGIFFAIFLNQVGRVPLPGISIAIGYLFFFISDCTLIYTTYVKDIRRRDFPIMLTYLLGEFGIVFGLILAII